MDYKRMLFLISSLLFCSQFLGLKAELDISYTDFEFSAYDPEYFKDPESSVWENYFYVNITLIKELPKDTLFRIQLLGATMGEYIVPTGIDSVFTLAEACEEPIVIQHVFNHFNTTSGNCPPKPGNYIADVLFDNFDTFPDTFPPNYYLSKTTISNLEETLLVMDCYQRIS